MMMIRRTNSFNIFISLVLALYDDILSLFEIVWFFKEIVYRVINASFTFFERDLPGPYRCRHYKQKIRFE